MIFNAFLIDDEMKALELLQTYVERIPFIRSVGQSRDPLQALELIQQQPVDVLFLDINLPHLSGVEFYRRLKNPPQLVFTTAYADYAVTGFDLKAVDYLLKPITFERFLEACRRVAERQQHQENPPATEFTDLVYIKSGSTLHKLKANEIIYLERDENYVVYHTAKNKILTRQTLSSLEQSLPDYFIRVHKSYIISLLHLDSLKGDQLKVQNQSIPIGKTFRAAVYDALK